VSIVFVAYACNQKFLLRPCSCLASVHVFAIVGSHPSPLKNIVTLMLILLNRLQVNKQWRIDQGIDDVEFKRNRIPYTLKKRNKEIEMGSVAKSYMRKGFQIYEEKRKYFTIYEEAVSHIGMTLQPIPSEFPSI
jgi:hypothetical protein